MGEPIDFREYQQKFLERKGNMSENLNETIKRAGLSIDYLSYSDDDIAKLSRFCLKTYTDKESLISKTIEIIELFGDEGVSSHAFSFCMYMMSLCLGCVSDQKTDIYYDCFLDVLSETLNLIKKEAALNNDIIVEFCFSTEGALKRFENYRTDVMAYKPLLMSLYSKAANYCMMECMYDAACAILEHQRNILVDYSEEIDIIPYVARIDRKLIMPFALTGHTDIAIEYGEEAIELLDELYKENPNKYAADIIELCSNLGGAYMDTDNLVKAEIIYSKGLKVWESAPQEVKNDDVVKVSKTVLSQNIEKLKNKTIK